MTNVKKKNFEAEVIAWKEKIIERRNLHEAYLSARFHPEKSDQHAAKKLLQQYWSDTAHLFLEHVRISSCGQHETEKLPIEMVVEIGWILEEIGRGNIPDSIEFARASGRPLLSHEIRDMAAAVFFLSAVDQGDWECKSPTKLVAECFNVTKQTVRNWKKDSDRICRNLGKPHLSLVEQSMRDAGSRYSMRGRGAPSD